MVYVIFASDPTKVQVVLWLGFGCDNNVLFIQLMDEHTNSWINSSIWIMAVTDSLNNIVNSARKISDFPRRSSDSCSSTLIKSNLAPFL